MDTSLLQLVIHLTNKSESGEQDLWRSPTHSEYPKATERFTDHDQYLIPIWPTLTRFLFRMYLKSCKLQIVFLLIYVFINCRLTSYLKNKSQVNSYVRKGLKGREWSRLVFAYPVTFNSEAPIGCVHSILGVTDQVSPYEAIKRGFWSRKKLCSEYQAKTIFQNFIFGWISKIQKNVPSFKKINFGWALSLEK